jgi:hypothetical protein
VGRSPTEGPTTTDVVLEVPARARRARRLSTGALALLVLAGALGVLGDRTSQVSARDGATTLTVTYAPVLRAGAPLVWRLELRDPDGLPAEVVLALDAGYLGMLDHQRFLPEPSEERREGDTLLLTFPTGGAARFVLEQDAYAEPAFSAARTGAAAVVGTALAVRFRTVQVP